MSKAKPDVYVPQTILDGCFRSFQAGISPIDVVADIGIDPAIVQHCYALFLKEPHAHGDRPGERGSTKASVWFIAGISEWKRIHGIPGNVTTWFRAAMDTVTCDPKLWDRTIARAQAIGRDPEPIANQYGLTGDDVLLAAFEIVYADEALRACCHERARELTRRAVQENSRLV